MNPEGLIPSALRDNSTSKLQHISFLKFWSHYKYHFDLKDNAALSAVRQAHCEMSHYDETKLSP